MTPTAQDGEEHVNPQPLVEVDAVARHTDGAAPVLALLRQLYDAVTDVHISPVEDQHAARKRLYGMHHRVELALGAYDGTLTELGRAVLAERRKS